MSRPDTGARERLQRAGLQLFASQGFEETTVAQVAHAAGLTERTFFRYFSDKREVVFNGQEQLQEMFAGAVRDAPDDLSPDELLTKAVVAASQSFDGARHGFSRLRRHVIDANTELQERELLKMAALTASIASALRARGVVEPFATLLAGHGVAVFRLSFDRWLQDAEVKTLAEIEDELFRNFKAVLSGV